MLYPDLLGPGPGTPGDTHPQKDVLGGVKAGGVDAGRVGGAALTHDATGVAGYRALGRLSSATALPHSATTTLTSATTTTAAATAGCVRHHKVYHAFCGPANLRKGAGIEKR